MCCECDFINIIVIVIVEGPESIWVHLFCVNVTLRDRLSSCHVSQLFGQENYYSYIYFYEEQEAYVWLWERRIRVVVVVVMVV